MRRLALALALLACVPAAPARADWAVTRGPFDAALVAQLKAKLAKNPHDTYALKKLVELYKKYRTLDQLAKEFKNPIVLGHIARERGELEKAASSYLLALDGDPRDVETRVALGDVELALKKPELARAAFESALRGGPDGKMRAALLRRLADLDGASTEPEAAARADDALTKLLELDPKNDDLRRERANLRERTHRYREALADVQKIAEHLGGDPGRQAQEYARMGSLAEAAGDDEAALADYRRAYDRVPRGHYLRREALEKIVGVYRRKDELRTLAGTWERDWPPASRGFVEWDVLARLYDENGDAAHAQECFAKALAADPHALESRRRVITLYEREGRDAEVITEYRRLIQAAPGEPRYRLELAERLRRSPDGAKEALTICERLGAETRDPSVHAQLAELYTRWGLTERALAERERLVKLEPDDDTHLINLGELYFMRGQRAQAVEVWKKILQHGAKREQAMARLADVYAEHNLNGESLDLYQRAAKLAPTDGAIKRGLAGALERMHRDGEAESLWVELFEGALAQHKRSDAFELRQRLIAVLVREGRLGMVAHQFQVRADGARDDQTSAGWSLIAAESFLRLGRLGEAESVLRALVERARDPEVKADGYIGLAGVFRARHQVRAQIQSLERAAELAPGRARELYAQIAQLSLELYRDNDALAYAQKAIALGPADAQSQLRLAEVLEKRDQIEQAVAAYQRALELDDRQWKVRFVLARLYLRRGEHAQAAHLYREVIRRAPDEELVVDAARRAIDLEEYLGTLGELERELQPLAYAHQDKPVYRNLLIELYHRHAGPLIAEARRGDGAARRELAKLGEHALGPLLEALVDGEAEQQRIAVRLLGELGNPGAAAPLLKLAMPPAHAAVATGRAHGELRSPFPAPDGRAVDLRVDAVIAGARLAEARELPALIKLAGDREKHVRLPALLALARLHDPAGEATLAHVLATDEQAEAQALACVGLGRGRSAARAVPELIKIVRDPMRGEVARAGCALALGLALDGAPEQPAARAALEETLGEGSGELQRQAAWALGVLGARRSAQVLVGALFVKREEARRAAAAALARVPGTRAQISWVDAPRGADGLDVGEWLSRLSEPPAPPAPIAWRGLESELAAGLTDALGRHRDLALRALADLDGPGGAIALGPLAPGPAAPQDRAALDELAARLRPSLEKLSHHADPLLRARVAPVLAKVPGGEAALAGLLADESPSVRTAALAAVELTRARRADATSRNREVANPRAADSDNAVDAALTRAFKSADWRERRAAALSLAARSAVLAPPPVLAALTQSLDDASGLVREAAARALGTAGPAGLAPLSRHLADEAPEVRLAVAGALGDTGDRAARAPLARLARDADPEVRAAAAAALDRLPRE